MSKTHPDSRDNVDHFVKVYGTRRNPDTTKACKRLDELGIPYCYVDIDSDPDSEQWVRNHLPGADLTPTLAIGSAVTSVASTPVLDQVLRRSGFVI